MTEQVPPDSIVLQLASLRQDVEQAHAKAHELVVGKKARITSGSYNGQPYGRSKPKLKGREFVISSVHLDPYGGISLCFDEQRLAAWLNEVEIIA